LFCSLLFFHNRLEVSGWQGTSFSLASAPNQEEVVAKDNEARKGKRWTDSRGQTYQELPHGFLLVNGTTYVCVIDGGGPSDWHPHLKRDQLPM
jgi:hypothetical protein